MGLSQQLAISKKSTFLSNLHETWSKYLAHEIIILTKFHEDWIKNVDFLLMANFCESPIFFTHSLYPASKETIVKPGILTKAFWVFKT